MCDDNRTYIFGGIVHYNTRVQDYIVKRTPTGPAGFTGPTAQLDQ